MLSSFERSIFAYSLVQIYELISGIASHPAHLREVPASGFKAFGYVCPEIDLNSVGWWIASCCGSDLVRHPDRHCRRNLTAYGGVWANLLCGEFNTSSHHDCAHGSVHWSAAICLGHRYCDTVAGVLSNLGDPWAINSDLCIANRTWLVRSYLFTNHACDSRRHLFQPASVDRVSVPRFPTVQIGNRTIPMKSGRTDLLQRSYPTESCTQELHLSDCGGHETMCPPSRAR